MMHNVVPALSILAMAVVMVLTVVLPLGLLVILAKKKKAAPLAFFVGCGVFLLFAMVLEGIANSLLFTHTEAGRRLQENLWAYALAGGLMAGLFEETGRFLAFSTVLKKLRDNDWNALMYGAGHGGMEAILTVGLTFLNQIIYAILLNTGHRELLTGQLSGQALTQMESLLSALVTTPSSAFWLGGLERLSAMLLHLALSVLVWFAVKEAGKRYLFPLAIVLHALFDAVMLVLARSGLALWAVELVCLGSALLIALLTALIWKSRKQAVEAEIAAQAAAEPERHI